MFCMRIYQNLLFKATLSTSITNSKNRSAWERIPTLNNTPNQLIFIKRWNSSTPLYSDTKITFGGGYFLIWNHHGIVIDPVYDFIELFRDEFSIEDINVVIVTHDHPDHCEDLPRILTVLREFNEDKDKPHRISFYVSYGVFFRYYILFQNEELNQSHPFYIFPLPTPNLQRDQGLS